ncbi:MAG: MarR family transcriptional regulator [Anaerolineae bacterium]|nr:MarR family transcriptional regulator [Anaerolineae bacterium]
MGSQSKKTEIDGKLVSELRQCYGLGASFFRAAAARIEMTDTDMQVIDILETSGEATAGELANLMALSTGTFTAILKRLEKAGLVHRERDPNDGRRVIVKLATGTDGKQEISPLFASLGKAWEEMADHYDDEHKAFLLEFLQHSNALAREEIARLRAMSVSDEGTFSAPLAGLEHAQLVISSDTFGLNLRAGELMDALYQSRFEGPMPDVKVKDGVVTIRYPRRLWLPGMKKRAAEVTLSTTIPWQIVLQGGASEITAELGDLKLASLEVKGGAYMARLELPAPSGVVPVRISGGASQTIIRRPTGTAARVHLKGWASEFTFDDQTFSAVGNDVRLQSQDFDPDVPYYDIDVDSSVSQLTITTG